MPASGVLSKESEVILWGFLSVPRGKVVETATLCSNSASQSSKEARPV